MAKATIVVENHASFLTNLPEEIHQKIWKALRFRDRGYFHSRLYKQKLWDGFIDFFGKTNGKFLTGLLYEIELGLKSLNVPYQIVDKTNPYDFKFKEIDKTFLHRWTPKGEEQIDLFDYQVEITNQVLKYRRATVQAPTSAGKTNILLSLVHSLPDNCPTLILANRKSLVDQNYNELKKWGVPNVGRLYDGKHEPNIITCATVQSIAKIEKLLPKMKAIFVDEIHEMMSKGPKKVYNKLKECSVRVAISATPFKFGGTDKVQKFSVKGYFGPVTECEDGQLTTAKLQKRKILSKSKCIFYPVHEPDLQYMIYQDAVTQGIATNWQFHKMVQRLVSTLSGRTLLLVERIEHGDTLAEMIPGALWVRGEDTLETRKVIIEKLKYAKQDTVAIATHGIFNTGLNCFIHNLCNLCGGQADHMIIQRMGRGLRTASDKEELNYYDFIFYINEYLYKHSMKRVKILTKEGHDIEIKEKFDL
jgi:superfamily II DNA or RNA helicase